MSTEKPLWDQFIEWLSGLFPLKASPSESGETPDKPSNPTPTPEVIQSTRKTEPLPTRRIDPRMRGLEPQ